MIRVFALKDETVLNTDSEDEANELAQTEDCEELPLDLFEGNESFACTENTKKVDGVWVFTLDAAGYLDDARAFKKEQINETCKQEIEAGFSSDALGETHTYAFTLEDQANFQATFLMAKELNEDRLFKCKDALGVSKYRWHTLAQLTAVAQAADNHKMNLLQKANTLKATLAATETLAQIESIQWV